MKKILKSLMLWSIFLVACSNENSKKIELLDAAFENNQTVENAAFETSYSVTSPEEKFDQTTEGAFIKNEDGSYDWIKISYPDTKDKTMYIEQVQENNIRYTRMYISNQESPTEEVIEGNKELPEELLPLFEKQDVEIFESITEREVDGNTHYIVTPTDQASEKIREENLAAIEKDITFLEKNNSPEEQIDILKNRVKEIEETAYENLTYTYVIDKSNYIIQFLYSLSVTPPETSSYTLEGIITITVYNQ